MKIPTFREFRREAIRCYVVALLRAAHGSTTEAAKIAHVNRTDFYKICKRAGVTPADFRTTRQRIKQKWLPRDQFTLKQLRSYYAERSAAAPDGRPKPK